MKYDQAKERINSCYSRVVGKEFKPTKINNEGFILSFIAITPVNVRTSGIDFSIYKWREADKEYFNQLKLQECKLIFVFNYNIEYLDKVLRFEEDYFLKHIAVN